MTFARPEALQLFWALAIIPLLYLVRRRARRRLVPHLFIWERVLAVQGSVRRRRLEDWLGMLLQSLIASALILAAAEPLGEARARVPGRIAIIVESGLQAAGQDAAGRTRLTAAAERIAADAESLLAFGEVSLWSAGEGLRPVLGRSDDVARLAAALAELPPPAGRVDVAALRSLIETIRARDPQAVIRFYGVGAFTGAADLFALPADVLQLVPIAEPGANAGITALRAEPAEGGAGHARVAVTITAQGGPFRGEVRLLLADEILATAPFELAAGGTGETHLEGAAPTDSRLEVRLASAAGTDALPADDLAAIRNLRPERYSLLVVAESVDRHLSGALRALDEWIDPAAAATVKPERWREAKDFDLTILVGVTEKEPLPPGAYILIDSHAPGLGLDRGESVPDIEIVGQPKNGSLLRGLDLRDLDIGEARSIRANPGIEVLLEGNSGALLSRGRSPLGADFVHLAFAASEANTSLVLLPAWPLLIQDAIRAIGPARGRLTPPALTAGRSFLLRGDGGTEPFWAEPLDGGIESRFGLHAEVPGAVVFAPSSPGSYRIGQGESGLATEVNVTDPELSNLMSRLVQGRAADPVPEPRFEPAETRLFGRFLVAALVLLVLEWLAFHRRWST